MAIFDELLYWHTEHLSYLARERLTGGVPSAAEALRGRVSLGDPARVRRVIVITATAFLLNGAALTAAELLVHQSLASAADLALRLHRRPGLADPGRPPHADDLVAAG